MSERRADAGDEPHRDDQPADQKANKQPSDFSDPVDEAADESFPASDPPSFTGTTATRDPGDAQRGH
jgi:hypothetical protein